MLHLGDCAWENEAIKIAEKKAVSFKILMKKFDAKILIIIPNSTIKMLSRIERNFAASDPELLKQNRQSKPTNELNILLSMCIFHSIKINSLR